MPHRIVNNLQWVMLFQNFVNMSLNFSNILDITGKLLSLTVTGVSLYIIVYDRFIKKPKEVIKEGE